MTVRSNSAATIVPVGWQDLCGITRVRAVRQPDLPGKALSGLSFPACGQAMDLFDGIVPNRWGPMGDVRQRPVLETEVTVPPIGDYPGFALVMAESVLPDGTPFDCCTRHLLRAALEDLRRETGLEFAAAFEHEFTLEGESFAPDLVMSLAAMRQVQPLAQAMVTALTHAGVPVEAIEPEFGKGQYELSTGHLWGVTSADKLVVTREIIRDVARHFGFRASFAPKISIPRPGNGAHVHFSLREAETGMPILYDPDAPDGLSDRGAAFTAGILRHAAAILPFVAPTPASYLRLGPGRWSAGFSAFGPANREALIRTCDLPLLDDERRRAAYNLEFRAADNAGNPYLMLAVLVRAGLHGMLQGYPRPPSLGSDPGALDGTELARMGIAALPTSLEAALAALAADDVARTWLPDALVETFVAIKSAEVERARGLDDEALCALYARIF
jgi:glutamine synthetase